MAGTYRMKIAAAGAIWFAFVSGASFPLLMQLFAGGSSDPIREAGGAVVTFGLPAGLVAFLLANPIVRSSYFEAIVLGAMLVLITNFLTPLLIGLRGSGFRNAWTAGVGLVLMDAVFLKGLPFLIGGVAALIFREAIQRSPGWWEWE
jgi:hypothetical protein